MWTIAPASATEHIITPICLHACLADELNYSWLPAAEPESL